MNEMKENKGAGLKYALFIGIPVIIILAILGSYYYMTNPISIFTKTLNTAYEKIDNLIMENNLNKDINIKETPLTVQGNISFKTDMDLNGLEDLQNYNYDINFGMDYQKELILLEIGMNEDKKDIIHGSFYQIENKQYIESKKLFEQLIEVSEEITQTNLDDLFLINSQSELLQNTNTNDLKFILKRGKEIFEKSLDKKYMDREKTDITIEGKNVKTTKITYKLNEENQKRTYNYIKEEFLKDKEIMQKIANMTGLTEEEIKSEWEKEEYDYDSDIKIVLYTEGFYQKVVKVSLLVDSIDTISYINYEKNQFLNIQDELILKIKEASKNKLDIDYNIKTEDISGTIRISGQQKNDKETNGNLYLSINSSEFNGEINLNLNIIVDQEIDIPDTKNAIKYEELTEEDMNKIFENLEEAIKGTFIFNAIENIIM